MANVKSPPAEKRKGVSLSLSEGILAWVLQRAQRDGVSMSSIVERHLRAARKRELDDRDMF